jgi:hypothetical protein
MEHLVKPGPVVLWILGARPRMIVLADHFPFVPSAQKVSASWQMP